MPHRLALLPLLFLTAPAAGQDAPSGGPVTPTFRDAVRAVERDAGALLDEFNVPGLSVASIADCRPAARFAAGHSGLPFGTPVTPDTQFQLASNGKVVEAVVALSMVGAGKFTLEQPLLTQADDATRRRWPAAGASTLRQTLAHTSGLSNAIWPMDRAPHTEPGAVFRYSGVGFLLVQDVLEAATGKTIDQLAGTHVFEPLGMRHSSFMARGPADRTWGVTTPVPAVLLIAGPWIALAGLLTAILLALRRWTAWHWPRRISAIPTAIGISFVVVLAVFTYPLGLSPAISYGVVTAVCGVLVWGLYALMRRRGAAIASLLTAVVTAAAAAIVVPRAWVPVPPVGIPLTHPHGAGAFTLVSTAGDMAIFLSELMRPDRLPKDAVALLLQPQIQIEPGTDWGLGIGLWQPQPGRRVIWHWGGNMGFKSLMVGEPDTCNGMVVLTNGENGAELAREIVRRVFGIDRSWRV